jgi:uncharacterized protein (TIGR00251 family)
LITPQAPYQWNGQDLLLWVRVQPRASKDEIAGVQGSHIKIRITAPPVEGKANSHLIRFLAKSFGVAKSNIQLLNGESSREKRLRIQLADKTRALELLSNL